jgi:hypothetical protein
MQEERNNSKTQAKNKNNAVYILLIIIPLNISNNNYSIFNSSTAQRPIKDKKKLVHINKGEN